MDAEAWIAGLQADREFQARYCLVAKTASHALVGVAHAWCTGFLKDMAVAPSWRCQGVGQALLATLGQRLQLDGLHEIRLKVHADNARAIAFYSALGLRPMR